MAVPEEYILVSTNIIEEFKELEHMAFILAMKIVEYETLDEFNKKINKIFSDFIMSCIEADKDIHNYYYKDDLEFALKDLNAGNSPFNVKIL